MTVHRIAASATAACLIAGGCGSGPPPVVGLVGDSITDLTRDPLHQVLDDDYQVHIVGDFGARAGQVLPEVDVVAEVEPDRVVVNLGTNDALQQIDPAVTARSIRQLLDSLPTVTCGYLVEVSEAITSDGESRAAAARAVNASLREIAAERGGVEVIPWNDVVRRNGGQGALTFDTVHLNDRGAVLLADAYRDALNRC